MLFGSHPFVGNQTQQLALIESQQIVFPNRNQYSVEYSEKIQDLILQLLQPKIYDRLGCQNDAEEVLNHPFFENLGDMVLLKPKTQRDFIEYDKLDALGLDQQRFNVSEEDMQLINKNENKFRIFTDEESRLARFCGSEEFTGYQFKH